MPCSPRPPRDHAVILGVPARLVTVAVDPDLPAVLLTFGAAGARATAALPGAVRRRALGRTRAWCGRCLPFGERICGSRSLRPVARRLAPELPTRRDLATLALYVASSAASKAIGVFVTDFLLSFWVAAVYVVLTTWALPALFRRLRRAGEGRG